MSVQAGEPYRFEQEVEFAGEHRYGFPNAGEILITRGDDGLTWNGAAFAAGKNWQATTVDVSDVDDPFHYYDWTVPAGADDGDSFTVRIRLADDPVTEAVFNLLVRDEASGGPGGSLPDGYLRLRSDGRVESVGGWL